MIRVAMLRVTQATFCSVRTIATTSRALGYGDNYIHQPGKTPRMSDVVREKPQDDFAADERIVSKEVKVSRELVERLKKATVYVPERADVLFKSIDIETRGHDPAVLKSYRTFALTAASELDLNVSKTWTPREIVWWRTLLKSVFVMKKARVQYATKTFFQCWRVERLTGSTASTYLEYIQRNLPEGVAMKVTKREVALLPTYLKTPESVA